MYYINVERRSATLCVCVLGGLSLSMAKEMRGKRGSDNRVRRIPGRVGGRAIGREEKKEKEKLGHANGRFWFSFPTLFVCVYVRLLMMMPTDVTGACLFFFFFVFFLIFEWENKKKTANVSKGIG